MFAEEVFINLVNVVAGKNDRSFVAADFDYNDITPDNFGLKLSSLKIYYTFGLENELAVFNVQPTGPRLNAFHAGTPFQCGVFSLKASMLN